MAPFTGNVRQPRQQLPTDYDAPAYSGAHNDTKYRVRTATSAANGLGQRKAVGIVFKANGAHKQGFQVMLQRLPVQAYSVGILDAAVRIERARCGDADGAA